MILEPEEPLLAHKRLLIVADGVLQSIPFGALPKPRPSGQRHESMAGMAAAKSGSEWVPLIVEHEIVCSPSASVLAELRREMGKRNPAPKVVAILADPVFDTKDERVTG